MSLNAEKIITIAWKFNELLTKKNDYPFIGATKVQSQCSVHAILGAVCRIEPRFEVWDPRNSPIPT